MRWQRRIARLGICAGLALVGTAVLGLGLISLSETVRAPDATRSVAATGAATCRVTQVSDGDTLHMDCGHGAREVRVMGYDLPKTRHLNCAAEKKAGEDATRKMSDLVASGPVTGVQIVGKDASGVDLARVSIGGKDVAATMLKTSYARPDGGQGQTDWCAIIANRQPATTASGPAAVPAAAPAYKPVAVSGSAKASWPAKMFMPATTDQTGQAFRPAPAFKSTD